MSVSDDAQLQNLDRLLKNWANNITDTTKEIISSAIQGKVFAGQDAHQHDAGQIFEDIRDRQSRVITTIQEAHNRQLELLKTAISEERKEFSRAQSVFEQSLRTKYEHSIEALRETIKSELDTRMTRTLKNLEYQAKVEGERAKQAHDFEFEVESKLTARLKGMISDLRKSWEEEETSRIKQTEEKLRSNYNIVLEHMEAQLRMALQLQEDADEKWLEELEQRNKKQLESVRLFEEKCRKLYETRLIEYAEKTSSQIAEYEEKLLEVGGVLAAEKNQFESRLRRMKLACSRWKISYQADIHSRYREMSSSLDDRYGSEITRLLTEIKDLKATLAETQRTVDLKEKEIKKAQEFYAADSAVSAMSSTQVRNSLSLKWEELKVSPAERIETLAALLDAAVVTPELLARYDDINSKLAARQPIVHLLNRKQFIEYKLKLSTQGGATALQPAEKATLIQELTEIKGGLEKLLRQYEKDFGESLNVSGTSLPPSSALPSASQPVPFATTATKSSVVVQDSVTEYPVNSASSPLVQSRINVYSSKSTDNRTQRKPI